MNSAKEDTLSTVHIDSNEEDTNVASNSKEGTKYYEQPKLAEICFESFSPNGNKIELIDLIGVDEESLENMVEYHGNPEDIEKFMNWQINFSFPDDEFNEQMNQELDKLRINSQDDFVNDLDQTKANSSEVNTQSTKDQTFDIDIFSEKKIPYKRSIKKHRNVPEIFKKIKLPTNDNDIYFWDISEFPNVQYFLEISLHLKFIKIEFSIIFHLISKLQDLVIF